jgi:hypothetical protein
MALVAPDSKFSMAINPTPSQRCRWALMRSAAARTAALSGFCMSHILSPARRCHQADVRVRAGGSAYQRLQR